MQNYFLKADFGGTTRERGMLADAIILVKQPQSSPMRYIFKKKKTTVIFTIIVLRQSP